MLTKLSVLQQSFCPRVHLFEVFSGFWSFSSQGFALPVTDRLTNFSQQKCILAVKEVVVNNTTAVKKIDNIFKKNRLTH